MSKKRPASEREGDDDATAGDDEKGAYVRTKKRSAPAPAEEQQEEQEEEVTGDPGDVLLSGYDHFGNPIIASKKKLASLNINDLVDSLCRR